MVGGRRMMTLFPEALCLLSPCDCLCHRRMWRWYWCNWEVCVFGGNIAEIEESLWRNSACTRAPQLVWFSWWSLGFILVLAISCVIQWITEVRQLQVAFAHNNAHSNKRSNSNTTLNSNTTQLLSNGCYLFTVTTWCPSLVVSEWHFEVCFFPCFVSHVTHLGRQQQQQHFKSQRMVWKGTVKMKRYFPICWEVSAYYVISIATRILYSAKRYNIVPSWVKEK